jgi:hypothetical protein
VPLSYVFFEAITPTRTATVQDLALLASAAGGAARMYLYTDNGGAPGTFVASSGSVTLASGVNGAAPTPGATVAAGTTYWLGAEFFTPSGSVSIYQKTSPGAIIYQYSHLKAGFGGPMPSPFGPSDTLVPITNTVFSFYMVVQNVP